MWKNLRVWGKLLVCILPLALVIIGSSFISYRAQSLMAESADRVEECEELRATFLNRAVDHFKWAQTLALYVALESSGDLNLVTDPSQCAFGKWYASQERKQAESIVPGLAQALRLAAEGGVRDYAYDRLVTPDSLTMDAPVPVVL